MSQPPYVLVADDDPLVRRSLNILLTAAGIRVVTVPDGAEALAQIRREHPRLAVLDVMMGRLNGLDLCRLLKTDPALQHIRVFLLTARALPIERQRGLAAGADDYIAKPFANRELVAQITAALTDPTGERIPR